MKKHQNQSEFRQTLTDLLCLAGVITLFYFIWLGRYPLFTPDEGRYSEVAREMLRTHDFVTPRVNGVPFLDKPALYYWLQSLSFALFGLKEWAVRFFPACFGVFGCLMTYGAGYSLFNRRTGRLAAIILATSPLYFAGAHYANLDLEVAVLISAALFSFLAAVKHKDNPSPRWLYTAYVFAGLAFLTKGMIGLVFPALIIGTWILLLKQWRLILRMRLPTGLLLFAGIVLPWYTLAQLANPDFLHYFFIGQQVTRFLSSGQFNNTTPCWFYLPILFVGFLPWACFLIQGLHAELKAALKNKSAKANEWFLLLWVGIVFLFFSLPHSKIITYILPLFPPMALLTAKYLDTHFETAKRHALATVIFTIITSIFGAFILLNYHFRWLSLPASMTMHLTVLGALLIFGGVISLCLSHLRMPILFNYMAIWSCIFLLTIVHGANQLNDHSTKPLITALKPHLQAQDVIVNYYTFYQDMPLYLDRTITLVADWQSPTIAEKDNWVRELWIHMKDRKEGNLIDNPTFAARWRNHQRMFVFLDAKYLNQLEATVGEYHLINQYHDIVLVSNQAT